MTDDNEALTIGGRVLYQRLFAERRRMARRLVERFGREIGAYQRLSSAELLDTIAAVTEENLRIFAESVRDRAAPSPGELVGPITVSAARRAGEGMALDGVMGAYSMGMLETWRAMVADARPEDLDHVLAFTELVLGYIHGAGTASAAAYLEERRRLDSGEQQRRHTLVSALLRGDPLEEPARRAGVRLAPRYLVLRLAFAAHEDETEPGVDATMAAQRKVHRAEQELAAAVGEPVLSLLDTTGGTALLAGEDWSAAEAVVDGLSRAAGVEVTAAGVAAEPPGVAGAVRQGGEILELASVFGRGPGFYRLADVVLEYQLTRPTAASGALRALLAPLDEHPDLLVTLETYLRLGLNRRQTAVRLHVHPNTVDYRVRKAVALTALDPADPAHLQLIGAALVIRRMTVGGRVRPVR
ncbi:putative transcriptional regulator [Actinokineospora spheciospongiae]|uniref:Putative transcriptional regulator n=1 Tax=Actinokineospora spheciospongiae TaxID=909613 RepID=W7IY75_9PSEU|nr:helix-turn-helix domain-containing protein [Actinokineospora spheciospongiae]EWC61812.1 putative transcriptional regulator [Actinokineospora spheciospongiae]